MRHDARIHDQKDLERNISNMRRDAERVLVEDVVIEHPRRLLLRSPDGTYWAVGVGDDGVLSTTNMGPTP